MRYSIITVNLNNLDGLKATASSILSQLCRDFEWIVVDGGSTDGSLEFLYALSDVCLRIVSERDDGIYDAMNKGISLARGEYINFMNAGDAFAAPSVLSEVEIIANSGEPVVIYGHAFEQSGNRLYLKRARHPKYNRFVMFTHHQAIFYRASFAKMVKYDMSYRFSSDWVMTIRILRTKGNFKCIDRPVCIFARGGISYQKSARPIFNGELYRIYREEQKMYYLEAIALWALKISINKMRSVAPRLYDMIRFSSVSK